MRTATDVLRTSTMALCLGAGIFLGCDTVDRPPQQRFNIAHELTLATIESGSLTLPNSATSIKFAVLGDSGRWSQEQRELAAQLTRFHERFAFQFVLMLGDNIYGGPPSAEDYRLRFEEPYDDLLDAGVDFYAALGNHDEASEVNYRPFNMKGERYYSFSPPEDLLAKIATRVEFFAIDTTHPDPTQIRWLDERLAKTKATWKICFFHHPLYTSGRYRISSRAYRSLLEPVLVRHGVDVAFSGHEHIYQRSRLQQGVQYFVSGGAGSVRLGDGVASPLIARSYSQDLHFMLVEIDRSELHFQAVSRTGRTIDAGSLLKEGPEKEVISAGRPSPPQAGSAGP